jgi:glutathione peroxidase
MRTTTVICTFAMAATSLSYAAAPKGTAEENRAKQHRTTPAEKSSAPEKESVKNAFSFELPGADGKGLPISAYKGRVVMIVNLGRKSSYNEQLNGLAKLQERYKDFVLIGVPCNDFGAAEPGTDDEIQKAYKGEAKIAFPITARAVLTGDQKIPLYEYLTKSKDAPAGGDVHWNFTKFVINGDGKVVARLDPDILPDSPEMLSTLDDIVGAPKNRPEIRKPERAPVKAKSPNSKT